MLRRNTRHHHVEERQAVAALGVVLRDLSVPVDVACPQCADAVFRLGDHDLRESFRQHHPVPKLSDHVYDFLHLLTTTKGSVA